MHKHEYLGDVVLQPQVDALVVYVHGPDNQIIGALDVIVDAITVRIANADEAKRKNVCPANCYVFLKPTSLTP
ncbi:MAG: hypothetical protein R6U20_01180 [Longimonas sp.]|uniref:hypothetical protein n=1 Tax=Longimonas sp. TaxID=2039626 RepID=UPI003975CF4F